MRPTRLPIPVLMLVSAIGCGGGTTAPDLGFIIQALGNVPTTAVVGTTIQATAKVLHKESGGATSPASGKVITLTVTAGGGTINGATTATVTTATDGSASAAWHLGSVIGPQTLRGSVSATEFLDFTLTATAPPASQLLLATAPSTAAQSGAVLAQQPAVQLKDANNSNVAQAGVQVTATIESGGGTLSGTTTATTNANGLATFADLAISGSVGNRTLKFSATLNGSTISVSSGTIALAAGAATQLTLATAPSANAQSGAVLAQQPAVQLKDAAANNVSQAGVAVTASVESGGGTLGGTLIAMTNSTGLATFTDLSLGGSAGNRTLKFSATLGGTATSVSSGTIVLTAGNLVIVDFSNCSGSAQPLWLAFQDGAGAWTRVVGNGSIYQFNVTQAKGGFAFVTLNGTNGKTLKFVLQTRAFLTNGTLNQCPLGSPLQPKTVNATVAGIGAGETGNLTFGGNIHASSANGATQFRVPTGPQDAVGYKQHNGGTLGQTSGADLGFLLRNQDIADGGTLGTLDLGGSNSFAPLATALNIPGTGGDKMGQAMSYITRDCAAAPWYSNQAVPIAPLTWYGVPVALQAAGDLHRVGITSVTPAGSTTFTRGLTQDVHDLAGATFTMGAQLPAPTLTNDPGNYARPHIVFTLPADYDLSVSVTLSSAFVFPVFSSSVITFQVSKDWLGGSSVDLSTANFSGMPGWSDAWPPASFSGGGYSATGTGSPSTTAACAEGRRQVTATIGITLP